MEPRVHTFDWAATPLGPMADWPRSLSAVVELLLVDPVPSIILWGPDLIQVYNDDYARVAAGKHPAALGRPARECWPEAWHINAPNCERVLAGGESALLVDQLVPTARTGTLEDAYFTMKYCPVRGDDGRAAGVFLTMFETTARALTPEGLGVAEFKRAEKALRESEERQAFLLKLADALRPLADPAAVEVEATRVLGEHLDADRALYCEVEPDEDYILVRRDYTSPATLSVAGRWRLSSFGPHWMEGYRAGRMLATADIRGIGGSQAAAFEAIGVRACVGVPIRKTGKLAGVLIVHSATPREWTPLEVALVQETADRTWAAVERTRAEAALRTSEGRLRAVAANLPNAAVFVVDPDLRYVLVEGPALRTAGFTPPDLEGKVVSEVMGRGLSAEHETNFRRALAGEEVSFEHSSHGRHYATHLAPLRDPEGRATEALAVSYEITDRVRAEEEVRRARDMLEVRVAERTADLEAEFTRRTDLARRLATAQEDERRRVSRDLHDSVGQLLAALPIAFGAIESSGELPASAASRLAEARHLVAAVSREVHALAVRLRPTALDDLGLEAALEQLVAEWSSQAGVATDFEASGIGLGRLPPEVETAVYRLVQEALTNVTKHARATLVSVVVSRPDGHVTAVIEDDGTGFVPGGVPKGRLGLGGMRERVALLGGLLEIESMPGKGTAILIRIPIPEGGGP